MAKRMTIRLVDELAFAVSSIAKKRGISSNALISEMAWCFVEKWKKSNNPNKKELEQDLVEYFDDEFKKGVDLT